MMINDLCQFGNPSSPSHFQVLYIIDPIYHTSKVGFVYLEQSLHVEAYLAVVLSIGFSLGGVVQDGNPVRESEQLLDS